MLLYDAPWQTHLTRTGARGASVIAGLLLSVAPVLSQGSPAITQDRLSVPLFTSQTGTVDLPLDSVAGRWVEIGSAASGRRLEVDLIRADVEVVESLSGIVAVRVDAQSHPDQLSRMALRAEWSGQSATLTDIFPQRIGLWAARECLPPPVSRGDFWTVSTRLKVVIRAPTSMSVRVRVRDGTVNDRRGAD